jgi:parallel beta-helix repeat protein
VRGSLGLEYGSTSNRTALDSEIVTLTGNKITKAYVGIYIASMSAHAQLRHMVVISNTVSSCDDGIDILQYTTDARLIEDVVVSYNTVDNNVGAAILLQGVSRGQVLANTLTNNLGLFGAGIIVAHSSRITISRNLIRHNNVDGIEIASSNDNMVIGNTATDNGRWRIALKNGSSRNVIMSNIAKGNIQYDLFDDQTGTGNVWKLNSYNTKNW